MEITIRPIEDEDIKRGFLDLLSVLTEVGESTDASLREHLFWQRMGHSTLEDEDERAFGTIKHTYVAIDDETDTLVGTASIIIEPKPYRSGKAAGHIEDVVVAHAFQRRGLGKMMVDTLIDVARSLDCYKVVLHCSVNKVPFYERCGFEVSGVEMRLNV